MRCCACTGIRSSGPAAIPGDRRAWRLRLRRRRLPGRYLAGIAAGIAGLIAVPYAEELWRCARRA